MSLGHGASVVTSGLVMACDMNNTQKSFKGKPTTNLTPNLGIQAIQAAPTVTYVGLENGWKKYSLDGTWAAGTYPYSIGVDAPTFTGGVTYSTGVYIKTNVPAKFASLFTGMNYVNVPMNNAGTSFSIAQPDGSIYVGRTGFQYTSTTAQVGYLLSQPVIGQTFSGATDFVYIKNGQIEVGDFPTPYTDGTRSNTQDVVDLTGNNILTSTSLTYASNNAVTFNGINNYATISTFTNKPTTALTCEAWIRPTKASVGTGLHRGGVISCTNTTYLGIIDSTDGGITFSLHWANQTSISRNGGFNGSIPNNQWSHIVGTYDGSVCKGYVNGVVVYDVAQTGTIPDGTWVIGTYGAGLTDGVHNFNGSIPVARIYNRALSSTEVQQNFNALRGRYGI